MIESKASGTSGEDHGPLAVPVIIFGEVLYDCFPDGRRVLGGAPFNVAWHLKGLGADPLFVSAVGEDGDGAEIRKSMINWGLDDRGLETSAQYATGTVDVQFKDGEPFYEIVAPRAWDRIADQGQCATELLYHGSLALRDQRSRSAFAAIRERSAGVRFLDLNLRPPHYELADLRELIRGVEWLKLNLDELGELAGREDLSFGQSDTVIDELRSGYGIGTVLLTAGKAGARLEGDYGSAIMAPAPAPKKMVDTVGAGDSFSAVSIYGILNGWSGNEILERASRFASRVCGLNGATTTDRNFYE